MKAGLVSVVLPVYNERENIAPCLRGLWKALAEVPHEILVCYDFDGDSTLPAIEAMPDRPPSVRLVKNTIGRGAANALRAGFAAARGDVVVTTMADLSDPPELIPRLADEVRAGNAVVAGSRYVEGGSQTGGPLLKRTFSRWAGLSLRWIAGVGTHDGTSNFRAYSKEFLSGLRVESRTGFEIALELTVKAHLAGLRVGEVPSSWVDRSAGESRFQMWRWMPNYLRWYLRGVAAPLLALALALGLFAASWVSCGGAGEDAPLYQAWVVVLAALGTGVVLLARRARGRTALPDLLQLALWMHPLHPDLAHGGLHLRDLALTAAASAALLLVSPGWRRLREWAAPDGRAREGLRTQRLLALVSLTLLVWIGGFYATEPSATDHLDMSWQQAMGEGLKARLRWGVDLIFTFGPLGYFARGTYDPQLFWQKLLWWEVGFRLLATGFLVVGAWRTREPMDRLLVFLGLILMLGGFDYFFFLTIFAVSLWQLDRPDRHPALQALGMVVVVLIACVKFTSFVLAVAAAGLVAVGIAWDRSPRLAGRFLLLHALVFLGIWSALGQHLLDLPQYLRYGLEIASGHNEAMAVVGSPEQFDQILVLLGCAALFALLHALPPPLGRRRLIGTALFLFSAFVAFKAGFTRHGGNSITAFTFIALAPFFLAAFTADPRQAAPWRTGATLARWACLGLGLYGYGLVLFPNSLSPRPLVETWTRMVAHNFGILEDFEGFRARREYERGLLIEFSALPEIQARVGNDPVDLLTQDQGILFINGLNWTPRPAFQSYITYTPALQEVNARFLEGEQAPPWLLYRFGTIDERFPNMDDAAALLVMARDYRPVLVERGTLLLRREPRPRGEVVRVERIAARFGEQIELPEPGTGLRLMTLDIRYTSRGKLQRTLLRSPPIFARVENSSGHASRYRVAPAMMTGGVIIDPWLDGPNAWFRWLAGRVGPRVQRIMLVAPEDCEDCYEAEYGMTLVEYEGLDPISDPELEASLQFSMFSTKPVDSQAPFPLGRQQLGRDEVLVVHAPSWLRFEVLPGRHRLRARYGMIPNSWRHGTTDGVQFQVALLPEDGKLRALYNRMLDPAAVQADRHMQELDLEFETDQPSSLYLRTGPGPNNNAARDWAYWTGVGIFSRP